MVDIIKKAEELLNQHNVTKAPVPVEDIAKALGAELRFSPYEGDLSGMLYRDDNHTVIGVNSAHPPNRQRFTIAHEIGHLVLHEGVELFVDQGFKVNFRGFGGSNKEENEANRFAAELLMPRKFLISDLNGSVEIESDDKVKELAKTYRVSLQAMSIRLSQLMDI